MKILVTGATGYIGRRLVRRLLELGHKDIRLYVRNKKKIEPYIQERVEIYQGDTFNIEPLENALEGVHTAYYLIHSMGGGPGKHKEFSSLDRVSAANFRDACIRKGVKQIVYLGGLGEKTSASMHLLSRIEVGEILSKKPNEIKTIWFRAGIIIGSGSASFEIVRNIVQKMPVMISPRWIDTKTQAICVHCVINYMSGAINIDADESVIIDIGGEVTNFKDILLRTAKVMGLKRRIFVVPVLTPKLSSYWLILMTPVPYSIAAPLVEGLKSETLCRNNNAEKYFPDMKMHKLEETVEMALEEIENNQVMSNWCDSTGGMYCDVPYVEEIAEAVFTYRLVHMESDTPGRMLFRSIFMLGGKEGWFRYNILWKTRGLMDKLIGGYGTSRGRRSSDSLRVGDSLDFWKVVDIQPDKRLLLKAQMKVPGQAWLEFKVEDGLLVQTAYYYPNGLLGRIYWIALLPIHYYVFNDLIKNIAKRAKNLQNSSSKKNSEDS